MSQSLRAAIAAAETHAHATGALLPVTVETETIEDGGVAFHAEWVSTLAMKDLAAKIPKAGDKPGDFNPFLPYEADLHVAHLSPTHAALLNKFQSRPGHLVVVTKTFVPQERPLDDADFGAAARLLAELDGLAFYNSGPAAGASQRHRHLQIIPDLEAPIAALLPAASAPGVLTRAPGLPFAHLYVRLPPGLFADVAAAAPRLAAWVRAAYRETGVARTPDEAGPYNLVLTRDWLLFVPRRAESVAGVSLAGLSFAGLIGLRSAEQMRVVRDYGPMRMLCEAAG